MRAAVVLVLIGAAGAVLGNVIAEWIHNGGAGDGQY